MKDTYSYDPEFDFLGDQLMNAKGAFVVPREMVGSHWQGQDLKKYPSHGHNLNLLPN